MHDPAPMRGVTATPLVDKEVFLVGRDIPIQKDIAGIPDLSDLPLILPSRAHSLRQLIDRLAAEKGTPLHPIAGVDGQPIIKLLLQEGIGASLLTYVAISEEVERSELTALKF
ncbi:MAG: LysR substrate-binding domain-containing protein, partial [Pseudomonadota bacterium]|nr:LysR substrate-binding domain-containing protein [Pseudomonadota bacterium]